MTAVVAALLTGCDRNGAAEPTGVLADGARPPNIVFILIDTLRADRLGCYGSTAGHSPTIDAIAAEGVVFDRVIAAAPWTQPSMASLFCGYYPTVHQVTSYEAAIGGAFKGQAAVRVFDDQAFVTLAEALQAGGYETAAFVSNRFLTREFGFAQGFDVFHEVEGKGRTLAPQVNQAALDWLAQRESDKPLFLYLHYMDVHGPYHADPRFIEPLLDAVDAQPGKRQLTQAEIAAMPGYLRNIPAHYPNRQRHQRLARFREYWAARYDAGVREMDHHLATLQDRLRDAGVWDDAYVIITSDHGEALCEHGTWDHGFTVHHTELSVPLVLRWPPILPAGRRVGGTVRLIDVMPTLLDQLRLPPVEGVQGVSLVQSIREGPPDAPLPALAEAVKAGPEQKALYSGDWKLVWLTQPPPTVPEYILHNLGRDPDETTDYGKADRAQSAALRQVLDELCLENRRLADAVQVDTISMDPDTIRDLTTVGYLQGMESPPPPQTQPTSTPTSSSATRP